MARLGWTSYVEDVGCFLVAGIIFSGAAVYYRSSHRVIEPMAEGLQTFTSHHE
jgi:hypothetical protein